MERIVQEGREAGKKIKEGNKIRSDRRGNVCRGVFLNKRLKNITI